MNNSSITIFKRVLSRRTWVILIKSSSTNYIGLFCSLDSNWPVRKLRCGSNWPIRELHSASNWPVKELGSGHMNCRLQSVHINLILLKPQSNYSGEGRHYGERRASDCSLLDDLNKNFPPSSHFIRILLNDCLVSMTGLECFWMIGNFGWLDQNNS